MPPAHSKLPASACSSAQLHGYLKDPKTPAPWLREAAKAPLVQRSPRLLRCLAEHPNLPEDVLQNLVRILSWEALASILYDGTSPQDLQAAATAQLTRLWARLDPAAMDVFARKAPRPLWGLVWKATEPSVLVQFLLNPRLDAGSLAELIEPPLTHLQAETLRESRFLQEIKIVERVLTVMAESFRDPATDLVLGLAAPWIMALPPEECRELAASLPYPPIERLAQTWASRLNPPA